MQTGSGQVLVVPLVSDDDVASLQRVLVKDPATVAMVVIPVPPQDDDALRLVRALELGIRVAVPQTAADAELRIARAAAAAGRVFIDPQLVETMVRGLHVRGDLRTGIELTDREREVLQLLVAGHTTAEIGRRLGIRFYTAQSHLKNLFRKLEVGSRAEATAMALRNHLV